VSGPRLLAFAASFRRNSWNRKLITLAADLAREGGADVDLADFREFDMPLYDGDVQAEPGIPPGAEEMARRVAAVDGIVIASPEYNFSMPGTLKNAIDWVSSPHAAIAGEADAVQGKDRVPAGRVERPGRRHSRALAAPDSARRAGRHAPP
jgi:NAD(P)H-dependent FMN reductase